MRVMITFTDGTRKAVSYDYECVAILYSALMHEYKDVKSVDVMHINAIQ